MYMCVSAYKPGGLFTLAAAATAGASWWINLGLLNKYSPWGNETGVTKNSTSMLLFSTLSQPLVTPSMISLLKISHLTPKSQKEVPLSIKDRKKSQRTCGCFLGAEG